MLRDIFTDLNERKPAHLTEMRILNAIILQQVEGIPGLTCSEIARQLGIPRTTVAGIVANYIGQGFLVHVEDDDDRTKRIEFCSFEFLTNWSADYMDYLLHAGSDTYGSMDAFLGLLKARAEILSSQPPSPPPEAE